ncbi:MAG: hypothetical protein LCH39_00900 [Proteobacteria bacterium]|nr:hypothetical protein [Pseudomonadota bacterium]
MKPLLITLAMTLALAAFGCFAYYTRISRYNPSIRSMVANEERQGRFLVAGLGLVVGAALAWWLA